MTKTYAIILGIIIVSFAIGLVVLVGGFVYIENKESLVDDHANSLINQPAVESSTSVAQGNFEEWGTYRNEEYGFEVKYPPAWFERKVEAFYTPTTTRSGEFRGNPLYDHYMFSPHALGTYDELIVFSDSGDGEKKSKNLLTIGTADFSPHDFISMNFIEYGATDDPKNIELRKVEEVLGDGFSCAGMSKDEFIPPLPFADFDALCGDGGVPRMVSREKLDGRWAFFSDFYPRVSKPPYIAIYEFLQGKKYILFEVKAADQDLVDRIVSTFRFIR